MVMSRKALESIAPALQRAVEPAVPSQPIELKPLDMRPSDFLKQIGELPTALDRFNFAINVWNTPTSQDDNSVKVRLIAATTMITTVDQALKETLEPKQMISALLSQSGAHKYNLAAYPYEHGVFIREVSVAMTNAATRFTSDTYKPKEIAPAPAQA